MLRNNLVSTFSLLALMGVACGGSSNSTGAGGSGGHAGSSGGASGATGGATGTGGAHATGGATGAGGTTPGSGGTAPGTGGTTPGTGGITAATGGVTGAAGSGHAGAAGSGAAAQLQNGTFNTNTAGWTPSTGAAITWNPNDSGSSSQSGSLDLAVTADSQAAAIQCVSAASGATYQMQAVTLLPNGGSCYAAIWFYASNDCSGSALSVSASTPSFATMTAWNQVYATALAPSGTQSAAVHLQAARPAGAASVDALFDNVSVTKQ